MTSFGTEAVSRLVLDTSAYAHFRKGHARVIDILANADVILVPATVLGELHGGFETGTRASENQRELFGFLGEAFVRVVPTTASVARHYGRVYAALRLAGTPIPTNDMWIAAAALDTGGRLLTFDRHFTSVPGLDSILLSV